MGGEVQPCILESITSRKLFGSFGLSVCVPSGHMLTSSSQGDGVRRLLGHEGSAPMNGISALIEETPGSSLPLPPLRTWQRHHLWTWKRNSPDTESSSALISHVSLQSCEEAMSVV